MDPFANALNVANVLVCTLMAALMTVMWRRIESTPAARHWMMAAWSILASDALLVCRPVLPAFLGIVVSTALYTLGHALLLYGARRFSGINRPNILAPSILVGHFIVLCGQVALNAPVEARIVVNGATWAVLSFAIAGTLKPEGPSPSIPIEYRLPKLMLVIHGTFHLSRCLMQVLYLGAGHEVFDLPEVHAVSFIEVTLFVVGTFVSLLVLQLLTRKNQIEKSLLEVKTLQGLLPMCASCKSIRDESGGWTRIESFISGRTNATVTHTLCPDCMAKLYPGMAHGAEPTRNIPRAAAAK